MKAAPTMTVKELNKRALTRYLYANGPATKQVLERELGLSLPTITQNLRALEQEGLVGKGEQLGSTGGRKAQINNPQWQHRLSSRTNDGTVSTYYRYNTFLRVQVPVQSSHRRLHALQ